MVTEILKIVLEIAKLKICRLENPFYAKDGPSDPGNRFFNALNRTKNIFLLAERNAFPYFPLDIILRVINAADFINEAVFKCQLAEHG